MALALGLTMMAAPVAGQPAPDAGRVTCLPEPGVDAALAASFCRALRDLAPDHDIRVHVLMADAGGIAARLDHVTPAGVRVGPRLDFTVMDRAPNPADLTGFARDLLRLGLAPLKGPHAHV